MASENVIAALNAVMEEMPAIGKDHKADPRQGGYKYRGIEDIASHVNPLLAKHGVVFCPTVESWSVKDIEVAGKPWTDTTLVVRYDIYGPGGVEDRISVTVLGIGRDNSDKGANKAITQAWKYALLQVLCIADQRDDGDRTSPEADARHEPITPRAQMMAELTEILNEMPETEHEACRTELRKTFGRPADMTIEDLEGALAIASNWPIPDSVAVEV